MRQVPTGQITTKTALARPLPASAGAWRAENIEVAKVKGEQQEARRARQGAGGGAAAPTRKALRNASTRLLPLAIAIEPVLEAHRSVELLNARSSGTLL